MSSVQRVTRAPAMKQPLFGREMHTFIAATPEVVFRYVTDIRRHTEWSAEPLEIKLDSGPEHGPGMTFTSIAAVGRNRIIGHGRVIAEEQPTRFVYECTDLFGCHR